MKIGHVALWVKDLEKIRNFYVKYFNCSCNAKYINKEKGFSSYFLSFSEGPRIEIMNRTDITEEIFSEVMGYTHIAIILENRSKVDIFTDKLKAEGVKIVSSPRVTGDGYYESVIADPEGNLIELVSGT